MLVTSLTSTVTGTPVLRPRPLLVLDQWLARLHSSSACQPESHPPDDVRASLRVKWRCWTITAVAFADHICIMWLTPKKTPPSGCRTASNHGSGHERRPATRRRDFTASARDDSVAWTAGEFKLPERRKKAFSSKCVWQASGLKGRGGARACHQRPRGGMLLLMLMATAAGRRREETMEGLRYRVDSGRAEPRKTEEECKQRVCPPLPAGPRRPHQEPPPPIPASSSSEGPQELLHELTAELLPLFKAP